jgi:MoaA/NifB/PqqE/SkfB family radical SAM enzyme
MSLSAPTSSTGRLSENPSRGRFFPRAGGLVAREADGYLLVASSGMRSLVRGAICRHIDESLEAGTATPGLIRLAEAHPALGDLIAWLATPAVPLTAYDVVRQDGFDTLFIELLGRCNERCVHCYADSAPTVTDALDRETVMSVIDQAAAAGFRRIQFTGGDPLLCEFLPEAVARAAEVGIEHREIYTNGLALSAGLLDQLEAGRPSFAFSFYSLDPEIHDRITRTPGSHRRTLAAIDRVVARGLRSRAAIVVMEENAARVDELVEFLKARGVGSVSWSRTFAVGRGTEVANSASSPRAIGPRTAESGGHSAPGGGRRGSGKLCVSYTGDIVPCIFQRQSVLGNVRSGVPLVDLLAASGRGPARRGLPVSDDSRQRLQCASCRLTDAALGWLGVNQAVTR